MGLGQRRSRRPPVGVVSPARCPLMGQAGMAEGAVVVGPVEAIFVMAERSDPGHNMHLTAYVVENIFRI